MTEASPGPDPLPYAAPVTRAPREKRLLVLVAVNALAAIASLWFLPLASHIHSCTGGEKWCHLSALVTGAPSALVWVVLTAVTASMTLAPQPIGPRPRRLKIAAWLLLSFAGVVLGALFAAVVHNSR
jgi:hypothetical protein